MKLTSSIILLILSAALLQAQNQATVTPEKPQETVITSDLFEMVGGETENYFYFKGNVVVTGTNLYATCDEMEVIADREQSEAEEKAVGKVGTIQSIIMKGDVDVEQSGRRAEAGRADIFPREGKVVLTENPKVIDNEGTVSGWRITLFKGEKRALVEGDPNNKSGERPKIQLPGFQDLGFEDKEKPEEPSSEPVRNPTSNFLNQ